MKWIMRTALTLLLTVVLAYAGVCAYLYIKQRDMLYIPPKEVTAPKVEGVAISVVKITTPDHETLNGWFTPPVKKDGLVFLYLPGQGGGLDMQAGRYKRMAAKGVGFLSLAYRGFFGSTGKPTEDGILTDGLAAYDWLIQQGYKPEQIVLHGHSLGSGPATYIATQRNARGLILEAPFTAASDVAQERYPYVPVGFLMKDKFANRERIRDVHMPVLIVHGDRDSVVPYRHGERLFALANEPKTFKRMAGEDHSTLTRAGVYDVYWKWLER
ncbi:alpha/beta hydrolase [Asticcacaulis sp. YBE204]|uniref:alpha/beta hydrolase n=1 Tax=Asticcacaulis sp. YBE204 TaxID=1282363 RepID=UPI0003C3EAF6|nr:alpha/beta hydrolase [Asticcacaulis sp. YBE204]ESQ81121.1 hypothetical protein AEYBE204_01965 [Asticcacaulis sp. YBE204]